VFTDLDGTLLDHDTYDWAPARPALAALQAAGVPVIPVSSKTLAELRPWCGRLGIDGPMVAENGAVLAYPGEEPQTAAPGYAAIRQLLVDLRGRHHWRFAGFGDMSGAEVSAATGLPPAEAARALRRQATEPVLWQDSEANLHQFEAQLAARGLRTLRGGRFLHVLGDTDKGRALCAVAARLDPTATTVALGDSPNDRAMLLAAAVPVVVRRKHDGHLRLAERPDARYTTEPGPAGWNRAVLDLLAHNEA
jgi:mannosyl-3-phosphoglycerate phosphatase